MMLALISARAELVEALASLSATAVSLTDASEVADTQPEAGWDALVIDLGPEPDRALAIIRRVKDELGLPILAVVDHATEVANVSEIDDFLVAPLRVEELRVRLRKLALPAAAIEDVIHFKDLELNLATYQATVGGEPLDLTFMEYELLRFFVTNPTRAWSRAQILSQVWGYDYFGGSRTVDVHVRRLRAKLGEERSSWIGTVRSVGYRFG
ncbi:MAG: response regulator transcription factor [Acidimicrobiia bacterium]|nr:response regulator transcription factor [Acidimicrobiia bacterium]MBT8217816.1 response regulator transcription factor [Acidimicrobiia bacterium]NNF11320.1 response regulator transcription factor [Acidimicrobiia bacterium]NNL70710.1 response regulator transcription factor [Acidimicrobiia bacterium]